MDHCLYFKKFLVLLTEFCNFRRYHNGAIALVGIAGEVLLVIVLGGVEGLQGDNLSDNGIGP